MQNGHSRRDFLKNMGLGAGALSLSACLGGYAASLHSKREPVVVTGQGSGARPNIVIFYQDDVDLDDIAAYGGVGRYSPNTDKLIQEGVKCIAGYVTSPVCTPSRYSLMTGQFASRSPFMQRQMPPANGPVNITWNANQLPEDVTIQEVLRGNGYVTGMVGKWMNQSDNTIAEFGFEPLTDSELWWNTDHVNATALEPNAPLSSGLKQKMQSNYAAVQNAVRSTGFDYAEAVYLTNIGDSYLPKVFQQHNEDWIAKKAIEYIDANKDAPFFLIVNSTLPHGPTGRMSMDIDIDGNPGSETLSLKTPNGYLDEPCGVLPSHAQIRLDCLSNGANAYQMGLAWLDYGTGAVIDRIDELGLGENTIIFYISDQQGGWGKLHAYDAARTPFITRWKGTWAANRECSELVANIDVASTIIDVCGAVAPSSMHLDGKSFDNVMKSPTTKHRDMLLIEIGYTRAVVTRDGWKYIAVRIPEELVQAAAVDGKLVTHYGSQVADAGEVRYDTGTIYPGYFDDDQLYDLNNDPGHQTNLAGVAEHAGKLAEMKENLRTLSAGMPYPFGEFSS